MVVMVKNIVFLYYINKGIKKMKKFFLTLFILFNISILSNDLPKPYLFYLEYPIYIEAICPVLNNIYAFVSGYNDNYKKYLWICLYKDGNNNNELLLKEWLYNIYNNSPIPILFIDVGNNTSSPYYSFILNNLQDK